MKLRNGEDIGININDILDELREENKRLFNELLFATKCVNELNSHLIEIHSKYDSMIGFEDKQHFNELRDQLNGICVQNDVKSEPTNDNSFDDLFFDVIHDDDEYVPSEDEELNDSENDVKKCSKKRKTSVKPSIRPEVKTIECPFIGCGFTSKDKKTLKRHGLRHQTERPFKCDDCHKTFKCRKALKSHSFIHLRVPKYGCPYEGCEKRFTLPSLLRKHSALHQNQPILRCGYDGCDEMLATDWQLYKHRVLAHNKPKRVRVQTNPIHACDWPGCDFRGISGALNSHKRLHTGERPYACEWPGCDKRFRMKPFLEEHKNIHLNLKPNVCHWPGCSYQSHNNGNLWSHIKRKHKT